MTESKEVHVEESNDKDYKSSVEGKPVSVKTLRYMITRLEEDMDRNVRAMSKIRRELEAIIEAIGEEW